MGFPYLAPLAPWVIDIMKQREDYPEMATFKSPWVILTSGALVVKGKASSDVETRRTELLAKIKTPEDPSYKGCIISNNINNTELSYSTQETIVGIDFTGKPIKVGDETGRKVSTPIVESIEIDTDGANNTLKTAKVSVRCFTLKQLEMFELFFLKPGMNVLVEFGDSTLLKNALFPFKKSKASESVTSKNEFNTLRNGEKVKITPFTKIEDALVPKKGDYNKWCEDFSQYYRSDTDAIAQYLERVEQSLGSYDLVAGKVLDYSFSIAADGTYDVSFEVSQGNQVSMAIPHNPKQSTNTVITTPAADKEFTSYAQILELLIADLNLGDGVVFKKLLNKPHSEKGGKWENEFFNFLKINKQQKDTVASDKAYVSLRFILEILMNYAVPETGGNIDVDFFKLSLQTYPDASGKEYKAIPVTSNVNIISSNPEIIFPTHELPKFIAVGKDKNEIGIASDKRISGLINGYDFHTSIKYQIPNSPNKQSITTTGNDRTGNALNIFINYETVVKAWNSSMTRIDFLEKILTICNQNSYGLWTLVFGLVENNGRTTVIDAKGAPTDAALAQDSEIYRFKPTTINSNVLEFSFNFEMSNLVAGRQIFNSGKLLAEAKLANPSGSTETIPLPPNAYKAIDNSTMGNADGWYSINNVELKRIQANWDSAKKSKVEKPETEIKKSETATTEADDITAVISQKSINFLLTKSAKDLTSLIFKDEPVVAKNILEKQAEDKFKKPTLSPIDVTITVDGFSGFTPGQYFRVDGIPEIYNQVGVFQITNTKHSISSEGWKTTIEASHRITPKK